MRCGREKRGGKEVGVGEKSKDEGRSKVEGACIVVMGRRRE